nr:hypothetical protein [Tanacetum cinerariifolium]
CIKLHKRRNCTLVEAARTMLILSKALMFLWAEAVATACYTQNPKILESFNQQLTLEYLLVMLQAPSRKGYRIYNKRTRRIMETIYVQFDELTEPMAPVHLSTGPAPTFLTPGQISSGLVPNPVPATPYAPPINKELEILFQPITPLSTTIDQDAPSPHILPSSSALQSYILPPGIIAEPHFMEDHNVTPVDNNPFVNVFAPEPHSEASSSGDISSTESSPVSTWKQLTTDALWCLYGSVLSKIEPKNFKSAIIENCWFQAMQDEIHKFDQL